MWEKAYEATWAALMHEKVVDRVARYYNRSANFAGATFLDVGPVDPYSFTEGDLLALTQLSVSVGPAAVRRLTESSRARAELVRLFSEENLPLDSDLAMADVVTPEAMKAAHVRVKQAISATDSSSANPWVTGSKLCARKRPTSSQSATTSSARRLVSSTGRTTTRSTGWSSGRLISDQSIRDRIVEIVEQARRRPGVDVGTGIRVCGTST